jgi:hypothetical protein
MSSEFKILKGECLCGEVSWELSGPYEFFGMCQCSRCRKVTGAAFATNLFVKANQFRWISGQENTGQYTLEPPNTFGNAFCKKCGSRAPRFIPSKGLMLAPLGSTMETPEIEPTLVCAKDHTDWFSGLEKIV